MHQMEPVFIGGCERSGTTFLGSLVGGHPACLTVPESQFVIQVFLALDKKQPFDPIQVFKQIQKHTRFQIWQLGIPSDFGHDIQSIESYSDLILKIIDLYGKTTKNDANNFWVDHTPLNVCYFSSLRQLFPKAKFIHMVRDGRAIASSILNLKDWPFVEVNTIAHLWLERLAYGLASEAYFDSNIIMRVKYEDLILEPVDTLQKICSFLNIDYSPTMLSGHGYELPSYTKKQHTLVGRPPDSSRINAWQNVLTARQIEIFESLTNNMLTYMGYIPLYANTQSRMTRYERLSANIHHIWKGWFVNTIRRWYRVNKLMKKL